jgi:hypothetical protein
MNLGQLIALARARLDDVSVQADGTPGPTLWSDGELTGFLNEAVREASERALLIRDEFTDEVTLLPITANQQVYPLHESVFKVDHVMYDDTGMVLQPSSEYELDDGMRMTAGYEGQGLSGYGAYTWWRNVKQNRARYFIVETLPTELLQLRLVPIPMEDTHPDPDGNTVPTQVRLCVYRYPLAVMVNDDDVPEIHPRHHERLIDWVAKRAFERRDRDTYDPAKSADAENAFVASFGQRFNANQQRKRRERRKDVARYREF